jgi:thiol-disulfide isomerase/thioredoxin
VNRRGWSLAAVAVAATAAGVVWQSRHGSGRSTGAGDPGAATAAFGDPALAGFWSQRLERVDGTVLALSSLRGQRLLVNFWATWCPPCVREMPLLDRFHRQSGAGNGRRAWRVVGLAIDRRDAVAEFLQRQPVGYDIVLAGLEGTQLSRDLGNAGGGLPFTVAIDEQGQVTRRKIGELTEAELQDWTAS